MNDLQKQHSADKKENHLNPRSVLESYFIMKRKQFCLTALYNLQSISDFFKTFGITYLIFSKHVFCSKANKQSKIKFRG